MERTLRDIMNYAETRRIAVGAFNIGNKDIFDMIIEAAEECGSPVIIECAPAELDFLGDEFFVYVKKKIQEASVPICLHLDHGRDMETVRRAADLGFQSVMIDASDKPFEENVRLTRSVCEFAHERNMDVEAELGIVGNTATASCGGAQEEQVQYTQPEQAETFCKHTGVDTLAVAIGTSHGMYPKNMKPKLRTDILDEIYQRVRVPLVLHGGSGNKDEELTASIRRGIRKINISSEVKEAYFQSMKTYMEKHPNEVKTQIIQAIPRLCAKEKVIDRIRLFRLEGEADGEFRI